MVLAAKTRADLALAAIAGFHVLTQLSKSFVAATVLFLICMSSVLVSSVVFLFLQ
jgi:hypothetical protein